MAQKVTVLLVDDIDGSEAGETISFGLDGTRYEIVNDRGRIPAHIVAKYEAENGK